MPIATASVDAYTIAFGIRNVTRIPKVTIHVHVSLINTGVFIRCLHTTNLSENFTDFYCLLSQALTEAYRVLAPGGRFLCLEFSEVENELLARYKKIYYYCTS